MTHTVSHEVQVSQVEPAADVPVNPSHSIYLPVNEEIAKALQIEQTAHVSFDGIVKEVDAGYDDSDHYSIRLDVQRVNIKHENLFEEMAREDEEED
jgi:hypothetical protein